MKVLRDDVRQRILDAARDEFVLNGYAGASMRTIARSAGMTVGNIYLYFSGKEQLWEAVVREPLAQLRELMEMRTASDTSIRELTASLHTIFIRNRLEFLILIDGSKGSKYEALKENVIDIARRRMADNQLDPDSAALCGPLAVALIEGLLFIFHHFDGDESRLSADLFRFLNYMLRGFLAGQPMEAMP